MKSVKSKNHSLPVETPHPREARLAGGVSPLIRPLVELAETAANSGRFVLEAEEVEALKLEHGVSEDELMLSLLDRAQEMARPPISKFHVGAVGLGVSGRMLLGVNIELHGMPLHHAVHAEQFVIANAVRVGEARLLRIAVSAMPCGHCRQFMTELPGVEELQITVLGGPPHRLAQLLPHRFGPEDLLPAGVGPRLLGRHDHGLKLTPGALDQLPEGLARTAIAALHHANQSYTPYSASPAGLALQCVSGSIHAGGVIESCAYNPTMNPLHTALVAATAQGMKSWDHIEHAVLVERPSSNVLHGKMYQLILEELSPGCQLHVLHAV